MLKSLVLFLRVEHCEAANKQHKWIHKVVRVRGILELYIINTLRLDLTALQWRIYSLGPIKFGWCLGKILLLI